MAHLEEPLRFRAGDASLAGTLTLPDPASDGRVPWALLLPSWLPRDRDGVWDRARHAGWFAAEGPPAADRTGLLRRLADVLASRGVASLRFDPRGCGESDGDWPATDLFTRIDDARDAIGAMRSRPELDLRRTAIVGHGEGAVAALSVAIGDPAISAVGLIGPSARSFRDVLRRGVAERSRSGVDREHPAVEALDRMAEELIERVERHDEAMPVRIGDEEVLIRLAGWEQAFRTPPLALVTMLHRNVVISHGAEDAWADAGESELLAEALRQQGNDPALTVVPAAGHDLAGDADAVADFGSALAARIESQELPPVLLAIEQMSTRR